MKKLLKFCVLCVCLLQLNNIQAQLVYDFSWEEPTGDYYGYPMVNVPVGDTHEIKYSFSENTMGNIWASENRSNFVFYDFTNGQQVIDESQACFSIDENGILTGIKEGIGAIKPTGRVLKATDTSFLMVKVMSSFEEEESNNTFDTANELKSLPTNFSLYNVTDVDYFKLYAKSGDQIKFIVTNTSGTSTLGYKWTTFASNLESWGSGNLLNEQQKMKLYAMSDGWYYFELYFDSSKGYSFKTVPLQITATINGNHLAIERIENDEQFTKKGIYTINGVSIGNNTGLLPKGIYIKNGKKFIVK